MNKFYSIARTLWIEKRFYLTARLAGLHEHHNDIQSCSLMSANSQGNGLYHSNPLAQDFTRKPC